MTRVFNFSSDFTIEKGDFGISLHSVLIISLANIVHMSGPARNPPSEGFWMELDPLDLTDPPYINLLAQDNHSLMVFDSDSEDVFTGPETPSLGGGTEEESSADLADSEPVREEDSSSLAADVDRLTLTGGHEEECLSEACLEKRKGRKVNSETLLLARFLNNKRHLGRSKAPKKEYLRVKVIRGLKRAIREVAKGQPPSRKKLHNPSPYAPNVWAAFSDFITSHPELVQLSATNEGPATDGKASRSKPEGQYRCYNNLCCKDFFDFPAVRQAYELYLELIFAQVEEKDLAEKLGFYAVARSAEERMLAWKDLKSYLAVQLIAELAVSGGRH